ncbi:hypothetical protein DTO271G3_4040 [Paecilomyces variotii]|nr:hypothetical protein DTO271G3_4040 [Paecilomyces variotii]
MHSYYIVLQSKDNLRSRGPDHPRRSVIPSFISSESELADTTPPGIINDAATEPSPSPTPSPSVHDADAKEPSKWSLGSKRPPRCLKKLSSAMREAQSCQGKTTSKRLIIGRSVLIPMKATKAGY